MSDSNSEERVRLDIEDGIGHGHPRPANKLNALYPEMILRLVDVIEQVRRDNAVRVHGAARRRPRLLRRRRPRPEDRFKYGPPDLQTRHADRLSARRRSTC